MNDCLTTRFVYDGANAVLELSAEGRSAYGGNVSYQVIWAWVNAPGLDQPVERIAFINGEARQRQVFHADGLGSIAALTDESGATIQTYAYEAFGSIRTQTGTDLNRVTFTAREAMGDTLGFFYYRHRIYDPHTGRFTSEDPLGFAADPNRYVYVINSPVNMTDALGMEGEGFDSDPIIKDFFDKLSQDAEWFSENEHEEGGHVNQCITNGEVTPVQWPPGTTYRIPVPDQYHIDKSNPNIIVLLTVHTHPPSEPKPSDQDKTNANARGVPLVILNFLENNTYYPPPCDN